MKQNDNENLKTPYYVVQEEKLLNNLELLKDVAQQSGCHILLAQKAFSMFALYPLIGQFLAGTTASGLFEAKLGYEHMGGETHIFSTAYREEEMEEIATICDHIIFNSVTQMNRYQEIVKKHQKKYGIRINPEFSTQDHAIYDPCSKGSRLGVTLEQFQNAKTDGKMEGISGIHFHTLCEQDSDDLIRTLQVVEEKFGTYLYDLEWVNFGGGHHITKEGYGVEALIRAIINFRKKYDVEVYLEPGEAIAYQAGVLVSSVLDIVENNGKIAILDTSPACHMPDVLEMPYRPFVVHSGMPFEKKCTYTFGGPTCLAGDMTTAYSFDEELKIGDTIVFTDMAIYTMVKNNTFNGMNLPSIVVEDVHGKMKIIKQFGYEDFKNRLS